MDARSVSRLSAGPLAGSRRWRHPCSTPGTGRRRRVPFDGRQPRPSRVQSAIWIARHSHQLERGRSPVPHPPVATYTERAPQYSPDGRRIVFESERSDFAERSGSPTPMGRISRDLAVAQAVGKARQAGRPTAASSPSIRRPRTARHLDNRGGRLKGCVEITTNGASNNIPTWSRDGRFIYFDTNRTGHPETWRVRLPDLTEELVSRHSSRATTAVCSSTNAKASLWFGPRRQRERAS